MRDAGHTSLGRADHHSALGEPYSVIVAASYGQSREKYVNIPCMSVRLSPFLDLSVV